MADNNSTIKTTVELDVQEANAQLIKLNATATDGTKDLTERINAKNKAVKIQNSLSDDAITNQEEEVKLLQGIGASSKDVEKAQTKLNATKLKALRLSENNAKQQSKLNKSYADSKDPIKNLDKATGGLIGKMQAFIANPIGATLALLVAGFQLFKTAVNSTEDGAAKFDAVMAGLSQVFTNVVTVLSDALQPAMDWLIEAISKYLSPTMVALGGYIDVMVAGFHAWVAVINLALTPLKAIVATAQAAALAIKGDFAEAKQVMIEFGESTKEAALGAVDAFVEVGKAGVEAIKNTADAFSAADSAGQGLISLAAKIELSQNRLNKSKREQELLDAKLNVTSKEALRDVKDFNKGFGERQAALEKYAETEKKRSDNERDILNREIALLEQRRSLGGNKKEDEEAYNQLLIKRINLNATLADKDREIIKLEKTLIAERSAAEAKAQSKIDAARKKRSDDEALEAKRKRDLLDKDLEAQFEIDAIDIERRKANGEEVLALELDFLERKKEQELDNAELTALERQAIEEKYAQAAISLEKAATASKSKSKQDLANNSIKSAGEAFGISKQVAIAEMVFAAPKAIGESFKTAAATYPFPLSLGMGALGAAGTVAPIISGLSKIKSTNVPGLPSGGGGGGGSTPAIPKAQSPTPITDISANNAARLGTDPSLSVNSTLSASANVQGSSSGNVVFSESSYNDFQNQVSFKEDKTTF